MRSKWVVILAAVLFISCSGDRPIGLMPAAVGPGPKVIFDLDARPLPEIPIPIDLATRADPGSPTGKRVNISVDAPTALERSIRRTANRLEGFGTYAPISVRFDAPLDLDNIYTRHRANRDFTDDVVLLVNIHKGSKHFGKTVPLDMGHGNFPLTLPRLDAYWENDPRAHVKNLLFDTTDEDVNQNGVLDPGEDTDNDGYLDKPNVYPEGASDLDGLMTWYEKVTNTLILRPVLPLQQEELYAVVLTKHLRGKDGNPVRSPFPYVNHTRQTQVLAPLAEALRMNGFTMDDVSFTWAFTTQGPTRDLEALRAGIYGHGVFSRLAQEFPPEITIVPAFSAGPRPYHITKDFLTRAFGIVAPFLGAEGAAGDALLESVDNIAYLVLGEVEGPNLLADKDGIATPGTPADDDEVWDLDRLTGRAYYKRHKIPFLCAIPKSDRGNGPPFPVAIYQHGYQSSRVEMAGFAGYIARYGIATCTTDAYGHGLALPADLVEFADALFAAFDALPLKNALIPGRARDLDNDGSPDPGGDFFTADLFHTRDTVRQSILDIMVLIRALRSLDGKRLSQQDLDGDGKPDIAGDFDGDGIVDLGGPKAEFFAWGQSLGGILSSILAGIEPTIVAAAPSAGGGGLTDIPIRSTQGGIPEAAILRLMGPLFVGEPGSGPGKVNISAIVASANQHSKRLIAEDVAVRPGDRIVIENLVNGEHYQDFARTDGRFRLHIAADALKGMTKRALFKITPPAAGTTPPPVADTRLLGDSLVIRIYDPGATVPREVIDTFRKDVAYEGLTYPAGAPLVSLAEGFGLQRNTPDIRRFAFLAQIMLEPGDPINYAPHYFLDPLTSSLSYDDAEPGANVLVIATGGDTNVPVSTGISIARAAGMIDLLNVDPRYGKTVNEVLIDNYIVEGLSWLRRFDGREVIIDPENLSEGAHQPSVPRLDPPLRITQRSGHGVVGLRIPLLDPKGQHAWSFPDPDQRFDTNALLIHMVGRYFKSKGREIREETCQATSTCDWIPAPSPPSE